MDSKLKYMKTPYIDTDYVRYNKLMQQFNSLPICSDFCSYHVDEGGNIHK